MKESKTQISQTQQGQPDDCGSGALPCSLVDFFLWVSPIIQCEIDPLEYTTEDIQLIIAHTLIHKYNQWAEGKYPQIDGEWTFPEIRESLGTDIT